MPWVDMRGLVSGRDLNRPGCHANGVSVTTVATHSNRTWQTLRGVFSSRVAWRNGSRCLGRMIWSPHGIMGNSLGHNRTRLHFVTLTPCVGYLAPAKRQATT